jgi:light-regulated signal transduction histidine kinase (bacteriophytochrome)
VPAQAQPGPAFGQADLSNCEREQIHLAGSIQPHGALLVVREPDLTVVQSSANAREFLGLAATPLGLRLDQLPGDLAARVAPHLAAPLAAIPMGVRCQVGRSAEMFDGLVHRLPGGGLVVELEHAGPAVEFSHHVEGALNRLLGAVSLRALCEEAASVFKDLSGYDRVMVYRFDEDGHGEVYSERREPHLEAFLGNRYPASDIPQIARRLYERNRVRVLVDIDCAAVPVEPAASPLGGGPLDMSLCFLRSMSPIHIQYLKNMGVGATLVVSLVVAGRLWGLIACHHYAPRFVHYEMRTVCELLAEAIATRIAGFESFVQAQVELAVRRLEQRMIEAISRDGDWRAALFDGSQALLQPMEATGAALLFEGQILTLGEVPATAQLRDIGAWLDDHCREGLYSTASLRTVDARFASLSAVASGLLAAPVSGAPGDYLLWFRPERIRFVTWGGNPFKPVDIGDDPRQLSPRRSFAQWHQLVEGTSDPWSEAELAAARLIGESVADVVLQFRSVRMLIARDQLEQVTRQVRFAGQPVIVADAAGRIVLTNESFERLLHTAHPALQWLEDLPLLFTDPAEVRRSLRELLRDRRSWRGEIEIESDGEPRSLLVRGDPVFSSPERVSGFVVLFTDLTDRKAAEAARRRFQEEVVGRHRVMNVPLDSRADLVFRNVLGTVVGNAQLAALEITDGVDLGRMPQMLEGVQASVARTAELLARLVWHASRDADNDA